MFISSLLQIIIRFREPNRFVCVKNAIINGLCTPLHFQRRCLFSFKSKVFVTSNTRLKALGTKNLRKIRQNSHPMKTNYNAEATSRGFHLQKANVTPTNTFNTLVIVARGLSPCISLAVLMKCLKVFVEQIKNVTS